MFNMKRMTALLMSVLIVGSAVCVSAMAAEAPVEEPGVVQEDIHQAEEPETEGAVTELTEDLENAEEDVAVEPVEQDVDTENSAENVTAEVAEPVEKVIEQENSTENVTSKEEGTDGITLIEEPVKEETADAGTTVAGVEEESAEAARAGDEGKGYKNGSKDRKRNSQQC